MRSRTLTFAAAVVLSTAIAHAQTPPPPPQQPMPRDSRVPEKTGTARLAGRVVAADTGRPLRRAIVRLGSPELREGRSTSTDAEGRWQVKDLPAGRYSIFISKGGYVSLQYGQRRPHEQGKPIELAEGQTIDKLDVSLPRGSVITGRVVDEFGEAVSGARVSAMRYRFIQGERRLVPIAMGDMTDDLGQYRLHGLPPGDYYISGVLQTGFGMEISGDRSGYAMTYYPGTPTVGEAQRVSVAVGQESSEITFALVPTRVASVSGVATTSGGKPLVNEPITLRPADPVSFGMGPMPGFGRTRPDGTFTISNIPPGEYRLETMVRASGDGAGFGEPIAEFASMPLTVAGRDISGVAVVTAPTAAARGSVLFEGGVPAGFSPGALNVMGMADPPGPMMFGGGQARVRDDWTFEAKGLAGRRVIRVMGLPPSWTLKSVVLNGQDVTDTAIEFKSAETVGGFEITLTQNMTSISGTAQGERGAPASDYVVIAFASDKSKWGPQTRFVRSARPDQSGKFLIKGLPPEEYLLIALDEFEMGTEGDPEVLESLRRVATPVTLAEGESKTLSLKLSRQP